MRSFKIENSFSVILFFSLLASFFSVSKSVVNPSYVIGAMLMAICAGTVIYRMKLDKASMPFIVFLVFVSICQLIAYRTNSVEEKTFLSSLLFSYSILLSIIVLVFAKHVGDNVIEIIYKHVLNVFLVFMLLELLLRVWMQGGNEGFYNYKNGFFYYDSNFTGLVILTFLFFYHFLKMKAIYRAPRYKFLFLWAFLILTFSRASVFSGLVSFFVFYSFNYIRLKSALVMGGGLVAVGFLFALHSSGVSFVEYDGSFNSKFNIISGALSYYNDGFSLREQVFGIGLGNAEHILGIFAHNIFVTFLFELGVLGSLSFISLMIYLVVKTGGAAWVVILPNFIAGFSLFSAYSPFLFVCLALVYHHEYGCRVK